MSRPFIYNDENFTVIGNLLFVHFNAVKEYEPEEPVIEVPPEIYKRLLVYSNLAVSSFSGDQRSNTFPIVIVEQNGRHYLALLDGRTGSKLSRRYYFCFYLLKDI